MNSLECHKNGQSNNAFRGITANENVNMIQGKFMENNSCHHLIKGAMTFGRMITSRRKLALCCHATNCHSGKRHYA